VFSVVSYGLAQFVNRTVATTGQTGGSVRLLQFSMLHDLAGIAIKTGDLRLPSRLWKITPKITLEVIKTYYDAADINPLTNNDRWDSDVLVSTDPREIQELMQVWAGAIAAHPRAYLARRADVVAAIYQIWGEVFYPFHRGISSNDVGLEVTATPLYESV